jgi:hypothetical protein
MCETKNAYKVYVKTRLENLPLGKLRRVPKNAIEIYFKEIDLENIIWTELAQDRVKWWTLL